MQGGDTMVADAALGGTIDEPTSPALLAVLALFVLVAVGAGHVSRRFSRSTAEVGAAG